MESNYCKECGELLEKVIIYSDNYNLYKCKNNCCKFKNIILEISEKK
jgi:hypothetical protein